MIRISDTRIDQLISEDIPYIDLTCEVLNITDAQGEMEYFTRENCILSGSDVVRRIMQRMNCDVISSKNDGDSLQADEVFMTVRGDAANLHAAWKVCLNMFDHMSGIATKARGMVNTVHAVNPHCEVLTTRKSMPGAKDLTTSAVMTGGAFPHRLGLSETVLIFSHHLTFCGGIEGFIEHIDDIKSRCIEKKLFIEASAENAPKLVRAGVDGVQVDKMTPERLSNLVNELREINPNITIVASGGINPENAKDYAGCGINGIVTTALFTAKPIDMSVHMREI